MRVFKEEKLAEQRFWVMSYIYDTAMTDKMSIQIPGRWEVSISPENSRPNRPQKEFRNSTGFLKTFGILSSWGSLTDMLTICRTCLKWLACPADLRKPVWRTMGKEHNHNIIEKNKLLIRVISFHFLSPMFFRHPNHAWYLWHISRPGDCHSYPYDFKPTKGQGTMVLIRICVILNVTN